MDSCNQAQTLINLFPADKFNFSNELTSEVIKFTNDQESLYKDERNSDRDSSLLSVSLHEDEPKQKCRRRNPENWKQNVRKRNKNKGLEYIKANGKICEKKKLGPPCSCKEKCYLKIGINTCEKIFQNFWKLGDHALQNAYIAGCVRIFLPKHCYKKDGIPSRRFFSRNFHVTVNGVDTEVCKQAFLNIHAISNGRLDRLLKKKQEIGNTGFDERGRHNNKVNKIPIEKIRLVRKHIDSVRLKAGYTGKRKPKKVELLPGVLNIRTMYRSYKEEMMLKGMEPVCEYRYRKIFHTDFHLDFGKVVSSHSDSGTDQKLPQLQKQSQGLEHITSQIYLTNEKQPDSLYQKNFNDKKVESSHKIAIEDVNLNVQLSTNFESNKEALIYTQLSVDNSKEFLLRGPEPNSYAVSQEIFRLDYPTNFSSPQRNWIFTNPS